MRRFVAAIADLLSSVPDSREADDALAFAEAIEEDVELALTTAEHAEDTAELDARLHRLDC